MLGLDLNFSGGTVTSLLFLLMACVAIGAGCFFLIQRKKQGTLVFKFPFRAVISTVRNNARQYKGSFHMAFSQNWRAERHSLIKTGRMFLNVKRLPAFNMSDFETAEDGVPTIKLLDCGNDCWKIETYSDASALGEVATRKTNEIRELTRKFNEVKTALENDKDADSIFARVNKAKEENNPEALAIAQSELDAKTTEARELAAKVAKANQELDALAFAIDEVNKNDTKYISLRADPDPTTKDFFIHEGRRLVEETTTLDPNAQLYTLAAWALVLCACLLVIYITLDKLGPIAASLNSGVQAIVDYNHLNTTHVASGGTMIPSGLVPPAPNLP